MNELVGQKIGAFEILGLLGEGGMGKVYRARDMRLKRDVAIKVLLPEVARDPERLARFEREAQLLAALSHPNIATIFGVEQVDDTTALVLEFVDGPTLTDRIARGPIPLDEALSIARQIAEALDAAHEQGIIHRDLKPANIKVKDDGTVKVLDFGLAKLIEPAGAALRSGSTLTQSPTVTTPAMTQAGMILGTAAYMSPEQAKGRPATKRSDIWAFGCVLYEMLTGSRLFAGDDVAETLASILKSEPEWACLSEETPQSLAVLLRAMLQKDPRLRVGAASTILYVLSQDSDQRIRAKQPNRKTRALYVAATATVLFATAAFVISVARTSPVPSVSVKHRHFTIPLGPVEAETPIGRHAIAISPDGTRIVFSAGGRLHIRVLSQLEHTPIAGTEAAEEPFFSPDGQWVGFWQQRKLKKVAVSGGAPVVLCDSPQLYGASWGVDDKILFGLNSQVLSIPSVGGTPQVVFDVGPEGSVHGPQLLPDGKTVLYTVRHAIARGGSWERAQIVARRVGEQKENVVAEGTDGRYVATGHVVFGRNGALLTIAFDPHTLNVRGSPSSFVTGLRATGGGNSGAMQFDVSRDGTLVYLPERPVVRSLVWLSRSGVEQPLPVPAGAYFTPRLSPDGTKIAVDERALANNGDVWVFDIARSTFTRVTFEAGSDVNPQWSPDGQYLIYGNDGAGSLNLFRRRVDGTGGPERLTTSPSTQSAMDITPDGSLVIFRLQQGDGLNDLYTFDLHAQSAIRPLIKTTADEQDASVSPDGRWIAYRSDESGRNEVYVRPFPNVETGRWQISSGGGWHPGWSRDGRELFFQTLTNTLMSVTVSPGQAFTASAAVKLLNTDTYFSSTNARSYDIARDGRFIVIKPLPRTDAPYAVVVDDWLDELKGGATPEK